MLIRIEKFEEIGRFAVLKHSAPRFEKLNLIYARNGYGKSTICSVLRSLSENNANFILARQRLGASRLPLVNLKWGDETSSVTFSKGSWNQNANSIHIFDNEYVKRNLHVGDSVTRDNKRNLLPIVLGVKGVELANIIAKIDAEQKICASNLNNAEKVIKASIPSITNVKAFCEFEIPIDIDEQIENSRKNFELAKSVSAVKQRQNLKLISLESFQFYKSIFEISLNDISENASKLMHDHIIAHNMDINANRWIKYGLEHISGSNCPFCSQDTSNVEIVEAFKGVFSQSYADVLAKVETTIKNIEEVCGSQFQNIRDLVNSNFVDFNFWNGVCELPESPNIEIETLKSGLYVLVSKLKEKLQSPHKKIDFSDDETKIEFSINQISQYNLILNEINKLIMKARDEAQITDVKKAEENFEKRKALKSKTSSPLSKEVENWKRLELERLVLEQSKKDAQQELRDYTINTITSKQKEINSLLELFGANFAISDTKASFVGREANTEFSILIGAHSVKVGEKLDTKPCFQTVLSSGDKFTLALAFFITQVRNDENLANSIIIFDDPFSSQDMSRQFETTSQIRALAQKSSQVIVFSHDPRFLNLISKNYRAAKEFQMSCDGMANGKISAWSSIDELKSIYVCQSERIREFASTGEFLEGVTAESLIKDLRPFLEYFIRSRFPSRFAQLTMLDGMAGEIENAGSDDPLFNFVEDFRAINEYSRDNMHGGAAKPDESQLRGQCKRIVSIIGSY